MPRFTKIPQDTFKAMQVEAGVICKNFNPENPDSFSEDDIICATTGGITVDCKPTYQDLGDDVDNCPVNVKELKRVTAWDVAMSFTSLGTSPELIKMALGCADIDDDKVTPRMDIKDEDFFDVWFVGDRADGGMVAVNMKNALSTDGLSLKTSKSGKGNISVNLAGHVSINKQDEVPMVFYSAEPNEG